MTRGASILLVVVAAMTAVTGRAASRLGRLVYVGTYTDGDSKGIYAFRFDGATGALTPAGLAVESPNPSFLATRPDGRVMRSRKPVATKAVACW